jgi:hypothetical protein
LSYCSLLGPALPFDISKAALLEDADGGVVLIGGESGMEQTDRQTDRQKDSQTESK